MNENIVIFTYPWPLSVFTKNSFPMKCGKCIENLDKWGHSGTVACRDADASKNYYDNTVKQ